jgi:hypothetical protein
MGLLCLLFSFIIIKGKTKSGSRRMEHGRGEEVKRWGNGMEG